jgi:hypothetical protein
MVVQEVIIRLLKVKGKMHCLGPWEQEAISGLVLVLL